ncbi:hypothetical protein D3C80_1482060 [compost metagenome]
MEDYAALLNAAVVPTTDDLALVDDHRTNGNAAVGQAFAGLLDGSLHEWIDYTRCAHDGSFPLSIN